MNNPVLENLSALKCIACGASSWNVTSGTVACERCENVYEINHSGAVIATPSFIDESKWEDVGTGFDLFKGNPRPIKANKMGGPRIKDLRANLGISGLAVNLGSGQDCYDNFINIDLGRYEPVHIVGDLTQVPLADKSIELVASNSVLEHIYDYTAVIDEVHRILKVGGYFYLCVPNACLRHHKYDYHRWTTPGLHKLFEDKFEIVDSGACRGVAYAVITFVEALLTYKFRSKLAKLIALKTWRFISYPLLWIDDEPSEEYQAMSQTIYVLGKKL